MGCCGSSDEKKTDGQKEPTAAQVDAQADVAIAVANKEIQEAQAAQAVADAIAADPKATEEQVEAAQAKADKEAAEADAACEVASKAIDAAEAQ